MEFEKLIRFYKERERFELKNASGVAYFRSSIMFMQKVLETLQTGTAKTRPLKGLLVEAGCGDGRILALAAQMGIACEGIEKDDPIIAECEKNLKKLHSEKVIPFLPKVNKGDFTTQNAFEKINNIGAVYNFQTETEKLSKRMNEELNYGTLLIYYEIKKVQTQFEGFEFLETYEPDTFKLYFPKTLSPQVHVYFKKEY